MFYEDLAFKNNALEEFKPDVIYVHTSFKNLKFSPKLSSSTLEVEQSFKNELAKCATEADYKKLIAMVDCIQFDMIERRILPYPHRKLQLKMAALKMSSKILRK